VAADPLPPAGLKPAAGAEVVVALITGALALLFARVPRSRSGYGL